MADLVASLDRPLPKPSWLTQPFWDAAKEGRLIVPRCNRCGSYFFRPEVACVNCLSLDWEWVESSGKGEIYSYSTVHRPAFPSFDVPYVIAAVALEEGWYMMSNVIGCDHEDVVIGLALQVQFVEVNGMHLPFFSPYDHRV